MPTRSSGKPESPCFYVPGEHDVLDEGRKAYRDRYGKGTHGAGWYSFDSKGVHFIGLVNVVDLKAGGFGNLGKISSSGWRTTSRACPRDPNRGLRAHSHSGPSIRNGAGAPTKRPGAVYLKRFGSVTVLNGHIHQIMQKVEGNVTFHTARSTAFPQPAPGSAPSPGPMKVAERQAALATQALPTSPSSVGSNVSPLLTSRCRAEMGNPDHGTVCK